MMVSFIAMNRILENQGAEDPAVRRRLERSGKVVLSQARSLVDVDLLARLRSFGIELDLKLYRELCNEHLSAEEISLALQRSRGNRGPAGLEKDWIWLSLVVLWERWFPDLPSFEQLDDRVQQGYECLKQDRGRACEIWLEAWDDVLRLCEKGGINSLEAFDNRCSFYSETSALGLGPDSGRPLRHRQQDTEPGQPGGFPGQSDGVQKLRSLEQRSEATQRIVKYTTVDPHRTG